MHIYTDVQTDEQIAVIINLVYIADVWSPKQQLEATTALKPPQRMNGAATWRMQPSLSLRSIP